MAGRVAGKVALITGAARGQGRRVKPIDISSAALFSGVHRPATPAAC